MQRTKAALLILFLLAVQLQTFSQKADGPDGTILMGRHYSFILKEPSDWIMDGDAAKSQGLESVLYRECASPLEFYPRY